MNFNLISPSVNGSNGNEYTISFKEPITIKANSKVQLNFCELQRNSTITFTDDQYITINIEAKDCYPSVYPDNVTVPNTGLGANNKTQKIPAGGYSYSELSAKITDEVNKVLLDSNLRYYACRDSANLVLNRDSDIVIGISLGQNYDDAPEHMSITNLTLNAHNGSSGDYGVQDYRNDSTAGGNIYDNYGLEDLGYFHYSMKCDAKTSANAWINCVASKPYTSQKGNIMMGLYSNQYAEGFGDAYPRTTGDNPPHLVPLGGQSRDVPAAFVSVEIEHLNSGGRIVISEAGNTTNYNTGRIQNWDNINQEIVKMNGVAYIDIQTAFEGALDSPIAFSFQTYLRSDTNSSEADKPNMYYRIARLQQGEGPVNPDDILFDSAIAHTYLPHSILKAKTGFAYTDENRVLSQIPFSVMASAERLDEGWRTLTFKDLNQDIVNPLTLVNKYTLTFTEQLGKVLRTKTTNALRPNICASDLFFQLIRDLRASWKLKSYSIECDSLPIKNYKNVENKRDGGFSKAILANVPVPFGQSDNLIVGDSGETDDGSLITVYQPYLPIVSQLNNNEISTNSLKIRILDMDDETPATEISNSTINFTITE
jgi:hypothetical protein